MRAAPTCEDGQTPNDRYARRLTGKDAARTLRLMAIVADAGWPTPTAVGHDASKQRGYSFSTPKM